MSVMQHPWFLTIGTLTESLVSYPESQEFLFNVSINGLASESNVACRGASCSNALYVKLLLYRYLTDVAERWWSRRQ